MVCVIVYTLTDKPKCGLGVTLELRRTGGGGLVLFIDERLAILAVTQPN